MIVPWMKYVSADIWQLLIVLALSPCVHGLDVRLCYTAGFLCNIVDWPATGRIAGEGARCG